LVQTNWMGWCLMEEEMVPSLTWPWIFGFGSAIAVLIGRYCGRFIGSLTSKEKHEEVCHLISKGWTTHLLSGVIILVHQCCFCTIQKANMKCLHFTGLNQKQKKDNASVIFIVFFKLSIAFPLFPILVNT
jgi:hypothetical protein